MTKKSQTKFFTPGELDAMCGLLNNIADGKKIDPKQLQTAMPVVDEVQNLINNPVKGFTVLAPVE